MKIKTIWNIIFYGAVIVLLPILIIGGTYMDKFYTDFQYLDTYSTYSRNIGMTIVKEEIEENKKQSQSSSSSSQSQSSSSSSPVQATGGGSNDVQMEYWSGYYTFGSNKITITDSGKKNATTCWNLLKEKGMSDISACAIIGNIGREVGGTFSPKYAEGKGDQDYIPSSGGYGLFQFTYYTYKDDLNALSKKTGKPVYDFELQIDYMWSTVKNTDYFKKMESCGSLTAATKLFMDGFERPNAKYAALNERIMYAGWYYNYFVEGKEVNVK